MGEKKTLEVSDGIKIFGLDDDEHQKTAVTPSPEEWQKLKKQEQRALITAEPVNIDLLKFGCENVVYESVKQECEYLLRLAQTNTEYKRVNHFGREHYIQEVSSFDDTWDTIRRETIKYAKQLERKLKFDENSSNYDSIFAEVEKHSPPLTIIFTAAFDEIEKANERSSVHLKIRDLLKEAVALQEAENRRKRDKPKLFDEYNKTTPGQLALFSLAIVETYSDANLDYSHTIELYDFMPKYVWGKVERIEGMLKPIERKFECRGMKYNLTLMPAFIKKNGHFTAYFPGRREELVEDALRKIITEGDGVYLNEEVSVVFRLYKLQKVLKEHGHNYSYDELKESLEILAKTDIEIESNDGNIKMIFSPIETYGIKGKEGEAQTFVRFSPLVTKCINQGTYRLLNYKKIMGYKSVIARQLHKRLSHNYVQASHLEKFSISLSTIIRDFGLTIQKRLQQNLQKVEEAIEELKSAEVIWKCDTEKRFDTSTKSKQPKLMDVMFVFSPDPNFVEEVKISNRASKGVKDHLQKV